MSIFGTDDKTRKACPILDGAILYFPRALAAIARHSVAGNAKHNPGEPLHWAHGKSTDQLNTAVRHIIDFKMGIVSEGEFDPLAAAAWRVLAALETELERREKDAAVYATDKAPTTQHDTAGLAFSPSDNCNCDTCRMWGKGKKIPGITDPSLQPQCEVIDRPAPGVEVGGTEACCGAPDAVPSSRLFRIATALRQSDGDRTHYRGCYLDRDHKGPCAVTLIRSLDDLGR